MEPVLIPFSYEDLELNIAILSDYLRFYDLNDTEPLIDREQIEDLIDWLLEAREKFYEYEEEDDSDE